MPIEHLGTVTAVKNGIVSVKISRNPACHDCDARHGCGLMSCQDKVIEVPSPHAADFHPGETVRLGMNAGQGWLAVFYAYILPLALMLATLVVALCAGFSEISAGISAIIILIPYYFGLFLTQKRIKKQFSFHISKIT